MEPTEILKGVKSIIVQPKDLGIIGAILKFHNLNPYPDVTLSNEVELKDECILEFKDGSESETIPISELFSFSARKNEFFENEIQSLETLSLTNPLVDKLLKHYKSQRVYFHKIINFYDNGFMYACDMSRDALGVLDPTPDPRRP